MMKALPGASRNEELSALTFTREAGLLLGEHLIELFLLFGIEEGPDLAVGILAQRLRLLALLG